MSTLRFDQPEWLLLALVALPLLVLGWRASRGFDLTRRITTLGLRSGLLIALAVVLAGPHMVREHHQLTVIGVLDVSGSVRRFADLPEIEDLGRRSNIEYLRRWFQQAVEVKEPDDRFGLIVFDGVATVISTPSKVVDLYTTLDIQRAEGTDLSEAIELALAMFPSDTARRIVLISDGVDTAGSPQRVVQAAQRAAGLSGIDAAARPMRTGTDQFAVPIDVLPLTYRVPGDVQMVRVESPPQAQPEQTITVRMILEATHETSGRLVLTQNGEPIDIAPQQPGFARRVTLPQGQSVHMAQVALGEESVNQFRAIFEPDDPADDALPDNNLAESFTITPSRGRIMVIDRHGAMPGDEEHALTALLQHAGLRAQTIGPQEFPQQYMHLAGHDLVILDNISGYELSMEQQQMLARYVNDLGGGLIMSGGEHSFGPGGWGGTPIEPLLPLLLDPPRELRLPTAAVVLVIDRSGSMNRQVSGARATQQDIANEGAALAIESLRKDSLVGVIAFDLMASTVVPLQPNEQPDRLAETVRNITAGGGTNFTSALRAAHEMLRDVEVEKKRVILLSDGLSVPGPYDSIVQQMHDDEIQVSTIAVGDDADFETLDRLARLGGGEFYPVRNPRLLPRIFVDSVRIVNKPLIKEGRFVPVPGPTPTSAALTAGLEAAPPLGGLVITAPRADAQVALELLHPDGEPLLAQWQAGLGRVAAFTSDAFGPWSESWIGWPVAETFWTQLARMTSRPPSSREAELVTRIEGDRLRIEVTMSDLIADDAAADNDPRRVLGDDADADMRATATVGYTTIAGTVYGPDGRAVPVRIPQTGPNQFETTIAAPISGNYIVTLTARRPGQPPVPIFGGASRTSNEEFRRFQSDIGLMEEVAAITGGRRLDLREPQAVNMFDRQGLPRSRSLLPVWRPLLIWVLALLLLDVACRRIAWSAATVRSLVARAVARVATARERGEKVAATLGTLTEVGRTAQQRLRTRSDAGETEMQAARRRSVPLRTADSPNAPSAFAEHELEARAQAEAEASAQRASFLRSRRTDRMHRDGADGAEDRRAGASRPAPVETSGTREPDQGRVRSALDALLGRSGSAADGSAAEDAKTAGDAASARAESNRHVGRPDGGDNATTGSGSSGEDGPSTTADLLATKRRARERLRGSGE